MNKEDFLKQVPASSIIYFLKKKKKPRQKQNPALTIAYIYTYSDKPLFKSIKHSKLNYENFNLPLTHIFWRCLPRQEVALLT